MSKKIKSSPSAVTHHVSRRLREGLLILVSAVALFLWVSFVTFHLNDPSWSSTGTSHGVANVGGRVGAWFADVFLYVFGYPAYLFPFMCVYGAWLFCFKYDDTQGFRLSYFSLRAFGFILILLATTSLAAIATHTKDFALPMGLGGVVGQLLGEMLVAFLNQGGAAIVLFAVLLAGITLFTGLSWFGFFDKVGKYSIRVCALTAIVLNKAWGWYRARDLKPKINFEKERGHWREEPVMEEGFSPSFDPSPLQEPVIYTASAAKKSAPVITEKAKRQQQTPLPRFDKAMGLPSLNLLNEPIASEEHVIAKEVLQRMSYEVEEKLKSFGILVKVVAIHPGPVVTRFELELAAGVKVSKITGLAKDLARSLSVLSVRVVEVIPGKAVVGLEVPNDYRETVYLREVLQSTPYQHARSPLTFGLGKDISGHPYVVDLEKMPHVLVAGTTGSGKSVAVNVMILSLLYKAGPEHVRFIMIDPKMLELSIYEGIPHLLTPVVTDMKEASNALRWCVAEMDRRYRLMASLGVRHLAGYNEKVQASVDQAKPILDPLFQTSAGQAPVYLEPLPSIVVFIDEFADMIMVVGKKVEELITRIAQKARAAGIHLVLATQRPSVDVITGLIKANIPTRIAFQVSQRIDSRTILDQQGAEHLLGHGDMLYLAPGTGVPVRVHGALVTDEEVHKVVDDWKRRGEPRYLEEITKDNAVDADNLTETQDLDPLYDEAVSIVTESRRASISYVQRRLKIGYNRSARLLEEMESQGVVSQMESNGSREVLAPPPPRN